MIRRGRGSVIIAALVAASCGGGEGVRATEPPHGPLWERAVMEVSLTTEAVGCQPYAEYQEMQTPGGDVVSGIEVCAEFNDACYCETSEEVRTGKALVTLDGDCLSWSFLESSFWAYATGVLCLEGNSWKPYVTPYPDSMCGVSIEPQMGESGPMRMELVCTWVTDDGSVKVNDRLLMQLSHAPL